MYRRIGRNWTRETKQKKNNNNNINKNFEGISNKEKKRGASVGSMVRASSPDTFQALYEIADKICCVPSLFRLYSHTNLCSFLSATECSCNLYRITSNLRPLSESSVNFTTVNFNVATFLRIVDFFFKLATEL